MYVCVRAGGSKSLEMLFLDETNLLFIYCSLWRGYVGIWKAIAPPPLFA